MIVQKDQCGKKVIVTDHAKERSKSRVCKGADIMRLLKKAIALGIGLDRAKGDLLEFIKSKYENYCTANLIKVYGHNVYVIKSNRKEYKLLTILDLPEYYWKFWDGYSRKYLKND